MENKDMFSNKGFNPSVLSTGVNNQSNDNPQVNIMEVIQQSIQQGIQQALSQTKIPKAGNEELDIEEQLKKEKEEAIKQHQKDNELKAMVKEEIQLEKDLDEINKGTYSEQTQKIMNAYRNSLKDDKKTLVKSLKKEALIDFFSKDEHNTYLPKSRQDEIEKFKTQPEVVDINDIWRLKNDVLELKEKEDQRKLEQKKEKGLTLNMNPAGFKKIYGI